MWGGEGVTFHNGAVTRMKKNLMKKNRNESRDDGVGKRADEEEQKKKCNKDPASNEKRKEGKRKRKKQRKRKKKDWKRRNLQR